MSSRRETLWPGESSREAAPHGEPGVEGLLQSPGRGESGTTQQGTADSTAASAQRAAEVFM
jgi:hypothetical protein